jgi:hypothetical protein
MIKYECDCCKKLDDQKMCSINVDGYYSAYTLNLCFKCIDTIERYLAKKCGFKIEK